MIPIHQGRRSTYAIERGQVSGLLRFLGVTVPRSRLRNPTPNQHGTPFEGSYSHDLPGRRHASFWLAPIDHFGLFDQAHRNWRQRHKTAVNDEAVLLNVAWHRLRRLFRARGFEV